MAENSSVITAVDDKDKVIMEHKGYYAFNVRMIQDFCDIEQIRPADMMGLIY